MRRKADWLAHLSALFILCILSKRLRENLRFLQLVKRDVPSTEHWPSVSVLVPARNESATVADCVRSLALQDYPNFEVIVLNDQSSDDTGAQLDALATEFTQVRVIHGDENPPPGWNGKSYACHRLAEAAQGDWFLFTDADTIHAPNSIQQGMMQAQALGIDMLSAFPHQITGSLFERLMVSFIIDFLPLIGLDFGGLSQGKSNSVAANGQYILLRAECYQQAGGHAAIFSDLVDDFALAGLFREQEYRIALVNGADMLSCRMYHNRGEVWSGFSKNIMLGLSSSQSLSPWQAPLFAFGYAAVFVISFFRIFQKQHRWLAGLEIAWLFALRAIAGRFLQRPAFKFLGHS